MPSLSSHPIFQIENKQYAVFKKDLRRNVVAFQGTEVYVAVGSTVRCAELREWYANEDQRDKKPYQVRPIPFSLLIARHWSSQVLLFKLKNFYGISLGHIWHL